MQIYQNRFTTGVTGKVSTGDPLYFPAEKNRRSQPPRENHLAGGDGAPAPLTGRSLGSRGLQSCGGTKWTESGESNFNTVFVDGF
ncbi:hypothetical protein GN956_G25214 [Arapaima gigas]